MMECPIAKLADANLAAIFKYLPPFERLIASEVCRKWRDLSKTPWRDVTHLDLSQVPTQHIHAVIRKCPNLTSVSALRQNLGDLGRFVSRLSNIVSLKCVDCTFTAAQNATDENELRASFVGASLEELIWHNSKTVLVAKAPPPREYHVPQRNSPALRRLQMSAVNLQGDDSCAAIGPTLCGLPLLESCILTDAKGYFTFLFAAAVHSSRAMFANLRELFLQSPHPFGTSLVHLPSLKILYLDNICFSAYQWTNFECVLQHSSLCVLVITASRAADVDDEILIPVRELFPNGLNAPPVPQLHLFLGNIAAEKLRFHPTPTDALKIYPIDAPMPEFLEKEEIKPIFEGSWIASRIREGAKDGANLADYAFEGSAESILYVLA